MISPVVGTLTNPGDVVSTLLIGDGLVIVSLTGTYSNVQLSIDAKTVGTSAFIPVLDCYGSSAAFNSDGSLAPLSNSTSPGGFLIKVPDAAAYSAVQVRLISGQGPVTVGIATTYASGGGSGSALSQATITNQDLSDVTDLLAALVSP